MSAAKFEALLKVAISGRLPSKFFVHAGDRVSARETRGMGYAIRAGVRTKFWDNKRYRTLQVTNFSVILPISGPGGAGEPGLRGGSRDRGVAFAAATRSRSSPTNSRCSRARRRTR